MHEIEFDVSYDYRRKRNVILIDTGDGDSIVLTRSQLLEMLDELNEADQSS